MVNIMREAFHLLWHQISHCLKLVLSSATSSTCRYNAQYIFHGYTALMRNYILLLTHKNITNKLLDRYNKL